MTHLSHIIPVLTLVMGVAMTAGCGGPSDADIDATVEARTQTTSEARLNPTSPIRNLITEIDAGIDLNKSPVPEGFPLAGAYPLHLAVVKGNKEIVEMLLAYGAKIDGRAANKDEATPLHWAAFFGQKDMVTLLIDSGAPINVLDRNHATPLDAAVFVWRLSQDDERKANHLMEIIRVLKDHEGKPADEL